MLPEPADGGEGTTILITVVAPGGGLTSTRVPTNVPVSQLAAGLGAKVNVANVTDLDDDTGTRISATSTLAEAGLTDGATVHVVAPGMVTPLPPRPPIEGGPAPAGGPAPFAHPGPVGGPDPFARPARSSRSAPVALIVVAAVVAAVVLFVLGGVVLGSSSSTATGPGRAGPHAATAWLAAESYSGPLAAGVPANLDRRGPLTGVSLQPAGQWHSGNQAGETFYVVPAGKTPYGLTVVTDHGKLAYPPTVGPLPFVVGRTPPAAPSQTTPSGTLPAPVTTWAQSEFGAKGPLPPALDLGLAGSPRGLTSWSPGAGGVVYRVQIPLGSTAPGTPDGMAIAAGQAAAAKVTAARVLLATDQAAATKAYAAGQAADATQKAAAAAGPVPPPVTAAVQAASAAYSAATQKLAADSAALTADEAAAAKTPATPKGPTVSTVATYDVWMRAQSVVGWAPASYGITTTATG